jgi:hypothetical protein
VLRLQFAIIGKSNAFILELEVDEHMRVAQAKSTRYHGQPGEVFDAIVDKILSHNG